MITDNTAKWQKKKLTNFASNEALPVGHIYQSLSKNVPLGSLPLFGGTYDRTLYADLWSWANENGLVVSEAEWQSMATAQGGSCSKFSTGNGSTTFRVPALKCWVKGANGVEEVGSYLQAGLPNIEGQLAGNRLGISSAIGGSGYGVGCFTGGIGDGRGILDAGSYGSYMDSAFSNSAALIQFNAKYSNPIYGNSNTVQPQSIVGMWLIVAYGTVTNVGNADVAEVMSAIENVQSNYLPLSGGNITGNLGVEGIINKAINTSELTLCGGVDANSAYLQLFGRDNPSLANVFYLGCTANLGLYGEPTGNLYWGENKVATNGALSMPSNKKINISVQQGVNDYIAPADGWIYMEVFFPTHDGGCRMVLVNHTASLKSTNYYNGTQNWGLIPVAKGDYCELAIWSSFSKIEYCHFIYAQSEV